MPGGVAPKFGSEKVSRYTGVSQLQLRVSRYTVQLRFSGVRKRVVPKGWFWQMFPCTEISTNKSFPAMLSWQRKAMVLMFLGPKNRNESTFTKKAPFYNFSSRTENNFGHPHPLYQQKNMPPKYAINEGSYGIKSLALLQNNGNFTEFHGFEP